MTKVQLSYEFVRPLTEGDEKGISDVHSWYGILRVAPAKTLDKLSVEYDASRLSEKEVEAVLHHFGVPIKRRWAIP